MAPVLRSLQAGQFMRDVVALTGLGYALLGAEYIRAVCADKPGGACRCSNRLSFQAPCGNQFST